MQWADAGARRRPYTAEQIDLLVAYIVAEDAWYVIPVEAFARRARLQLYPTGSQYGGFYEKYREAWDLMKQDPECRDLDRSWALGQANLGAGTHTRAAARRDRMSWIDAPNAAA